MSNGTPIVPLPLGDDGDQAEAHDSSANTPTVEREDGNKRFDGEADDSLIYSADADRLAAEEGSSTR